MSKYTICFMLAQIIFIQTVFGQCLRNSIVPSIQSAPPITNIGNGYGNIANNIGLIGNNAYLSNNVNLGNNAANSALIRNSAANSAFAANAAIFDVENVGYGGQGTGEFYAIGDMPVAGNTAINGNLPVYGIIQFDGSLPASGLVSISGCTPCIC